MSKDMTVPAGRGGRIVGWGVALPDEVLDNVTLAARFGVEPGWITERTGIEQRRINRGASTASLAVSAGRSALEMAGATPSSVDMVILATTTPDAVMPPTSVEVSSRLEIPGGSVDLNAACSGFVFGLVHAHGLLRMGMSRVLLIGAETMSRVTDPGDRDTAILFGDGAAAVLLDSSENGDQLVSFDMGGDGTGRHLLTAPLGGHMEMDGREIFRRAVRVIVDSSERSLRSAGVSIDEVAVVIPHQANIRIIHAACGRLGVRLDKVMTPLQCTGNTSSASIPLALSQALAEGRIGEGDLVLLVGFGAGMSWGSVVLRWSAVALYGDTAVAAPVSLTPAR